MSWLLQDHIYKATSMGNQINFNMMIAKEDRERVPEEYIYERMKAYMKHSFGDYLVRNKVRWTERYDTLHHADIVEAEVFCFSRSELEAFLKSIMNYPEEIHGNHLGLSEI